MDTIGLDVHKRESQLRIDHDNGSIEERRIVTSRADSRRRACDRKPPRNYGTSGESVVRNFSCSKVWTRRRINPTS